MLYVGRVWLKYSEDEFWHMTPRKFEAQLRVHMEMLKMQSGSSSAPGQGIVQDGYIDQIPGW